MDALVVVEDDSILKELGLTRGTMHPVDHDQWQAAYDKLRHLDITFDSGGSCANTIAAVGRLGGQALYCGHVGDDQLGHHYAKLIGEACGQHALRFSRDDHTGKCLSIISSSDAERTMLTDLGAAIALPELGDFGQDIDNASVAHFTGYTLLPGPMHNVALTAMRRAHESGVKVSLDAADPFVVVALRDLLWEVLETYCDIVFLNADEARQLTEQEPEAAIRTIAERANIETIVVKLGADGSLVWHKGETHQVGIHKVTAIDTTGAGDAYAGGFLYALTQGWTPKRCGALGAAVAALTVAQIGAVVRDRSKLAGALRAADELTAL